MEIVLKWEVANKLMLCIALLNSREQSTENGLENGRQLFLN